jgi:SpoVK/Ycf46/Vps4 family AAA+-type ATPase
LGEDVPVALWTPAAVIDLIKPITYTHHAGADLKAILAEAQLLAVHSTLEAVSQGPKPQAVTMQHVQRALLSVRPSVQGMQHQHRELAGHSSMHKRTTLA